MVQHYPATSILPNEIPEMEDAKLIWRQLITNDQAPHFIMRFGEIKSRASHQFGSEQREREIYLLSGHLDINGWSKFRTLLSPNDFIYVPPETPIHITNTSDQKASFLEICPKSDEVLKKMPNRSSILYGHYTDIDATRVTLFGSTHTTIRVLIKDEKSHQMFMRRFEIEPGGTIGIHQHDWEHEMYILEGKMFLLNLKGHKEEVHAGEFIYMPPMEHHGYRNESTKKVVFICMIPNLKFQ